MPGLGVSQKPIVMPSYPHMLAEDTEVWSKFLADPMDAISEVWYDVHVGQAVLLPVGASDLDKRIARGLTRKRIDVVCAVSGGLWVVEVKPVASMVALGQVLTYQRLFIEEYRPTREVLGVVVCDSIDRDLFREFEADGVMVITV